MANHGHHLHGTPFPPLDAALSDRLKVGLTAIANSPEEVDDLYQRTLTILDREASRGHYRTPDPSAGGHI